MRVKSSSATAVSVMAVVNSSIRVACSSEWLLLCALSASGVFSNLVTAVAVSGAPCTSIGDFMV